MNENLIKAIREWTSILTSINILLSKENLKLYRKSSLGEFFNTPCVLKPDSCEKLSLCLAIANRYKIKVFAISKGQNHGYNSSTPMADETVVIDLRLLNNILEYNSEFGYVLIEPGISFFDLYTYLARCNSDYIMSGFTGSPDASIIGNTLDRGTGRGSLGNRELSCLVKEIILPNGNQIDLRDRYQSSDITESLQYSTVGTDISNLFYQSSLAIVTKMIVYLEPIPDYLLTLSLAVQNDAKLLELVDKFQILTKKQIIKPTYSFYNDFRELVRSGYKKPKYDIKKNIDILLGQLKTQSNYQIEKWNTSLAIHCVCEEDMVLKQKLILQLLENLTNNLSFSNINKEQSKKLIKKSIVKNFSPTPKELKFLINLGYTQGNCMKFKSC